MTRYMNTQEKFQIGVTRALAIAGLIAVLAAGIWIMVQIVGFLPEAYTRLSSAAITLTSVFNPKEEKIVLLLPSYSTAHGEPFTFSFAHDTKEEGSYAFSYGCKENVSVEEGLADSRQKILCDTPFPIGAESKTITIIPLSPKNRFIDVPLEVRFTKANESAPSVTESALLTIVNTDVPDSKDTTGPSRPSQPVSNSGTTGSVSVKPGPKEEVTFPVGGTVSTTPTPSNPSGTADLSVKIIDVGIVSRSSSEFTATSSVRATDRAAVRFTVENLGTKVSDSWTFSAVLPTSPAYIFDSQSQRVLLPGERIEFTLGFDSIVAPTDTALAHITINIDPTNSLREVTKNNNIAKTTIIVQQ